MEKTSAGAIRWAINIFPETWEESNKMEDKISTLENYIEQKNKYVLAITQNFLALTKTKKP